jgi:hypothetical protein
MCKGLWEVFYTSDHEVKIRMLGSKKTSGGFGVPSRTNNAFALACVTVDQRNYEATGIKLRVISSDTLLHAYVNYGFVFCVDPKTFSIVGSVNWDNVPIDDKDRIAEMLLKSSVFKG